MSGGAPGPQSRIVRFGIFEANLDTGELRRDGLPVKIQDQPSRLLMYLLERPGDIVTREELRAALWPDGSFVDFEYGVNTAVKKVRSALGDSAGSPSFIQTLPRKGYRLVAAVSREGPPTLVAPSPVAAPPKGRRAWVSVVALSAVFAGVWFLVPPFVPRPAALPAPLTAYAGSEWSPAFSPDGRQVAFAWDGVDEDNYDIYVKTNGSDVLTRVTTDPAPDLSPAWSPDGRRIAFLRDIGPGRVAVMIAPTGGGVAVKIAETNAPLLPQYRNLAFTPDGNWLITTAGGDVVPGQNGDGGGLALYSAENGARRPLTIPPAGYFADTNPAVSPDGRSLAFLRGTDLASVDLYVLRLDTNWSASGEPRRLTSWNRFALSPMWTADGREIILASGEYFNTRLWRVPVSGSGTPAIVASAGDGALLPALAPDGRLALTQRHRNVSIWTLDLAALRPAGSRLRRWSASSTRIDTHPRFSPDGRRVAFVSTRTGNYQIWIANADGRGAFQLTSMTTTLLSMPGWSPDGSTILFHAVKDGRFELYAVSAAGGTPHRLLQSSAHVGGATFSADARWIFFGSDSVGGFQIWRMPAQGGEPVQLTRGGGQGARESADGRYLYFGKAACSSPGREPAAGGRAGGVTDWLNPPCSSLWRMPVGGGEETKVLDSLLGLSFDLTENGVYYVGACGADGSCPMYFYSFSTGKRTPLAATSLPGNNGLAVSPDGLTLLRGQITGIGADLMVLDGFR
jgi:Tol biopolymer transport system component/DNA-binding winged helix-turn-helix (wHTH) protein